MGCKRLSRAVVVAAGLLFGWPATSVAQTFNQVCTARAAPVLEARGTQLTVDSQPRFLVLVSYFDAMRASRAAIESDFAFLKQKGVDGIRIFPTWIRDAGLPTAQTPDATLLKSDGSIRSQERWDHFAFVLGRAAACGFIVDLSFTRDNLNTVSPFTPGDYAGDPKLTTCGGGKEGRGKGLAEVACRLKTPAYLHVFIDIQNERNAGNPGMHLTMPEVRVIRNAIKLVDANRLVMMSHGGGDTTNALAAVQEAQLDLIAVHEEQIANWFEKTAAVLNTLKGPKKPIYVQEGARAAAPGERFRGVVCARSSPEKNPFIEGMNAAKQAGAAAWTFHTDAGFRLDTQSFQKELAACQRETDFLNTFKK